MRNDQNISLTSNRVAVILEQIWPFNSSTCVIPKHCNSRSLQSRKFSSKVEKSSWNIRGKRKFFMIFVSDFFLECYLEKFLYAFKLFRTWSFRQFLPSSRIVASHEQNQPDLPCLIRKSELKCSLWKSYFGIKSKKKIPNLSMMWSAMLELDKLTTDELKTTKKNCWKIRNVNDKKDMATKGKGQTKRAFSIRR